MTLARPLHEDGLHLLTTMRYRMVEKVTLLTHPAQARRDALCTKPRSRLATRLNGERKILETKKQW